MVGSSFWNYSFRSLFFSTSVAICTPEFYFGEAEPVCPKDAPLKSLVTVARNPDEGDAEPQTQADLRAGDSASL